MQRDHSSLLALNVSLLVALLIIPCNPVSGEENPPVVKKNAGSSPAPTAKEKGPTARITKVVSDSWVQGPSAAGLGDVVSVTITPWNNEWDPKAWVLYLDGIALDGVHPDNRDFRDHVVRFSLRRAAESERAWGLLFRSPSGLAWSRPVPVAVGPTSGVEPSIAAYPTDGEGQPGVPPFRLVIISWPSFLVGLLFPVALVVGLLFANRQTDLLRNTSFDRRDDGTKRPYSLGKVQMAFWTVLIFASYLYLGVLTWDYFHTLSASALVLLGISGATGLGAILIDQDKQARARQLEVERDALNTRLASTPDVTQRAPMQTRLAAVQTGLDNAPPQTTESRGFIRDLLNDDGIPSLHRVQIVLWTLTLGAIFVVSVIRDLTMPTFDATLLTLMGISSGTYLGFKFPERKT